MEDIVINYKYKSLKELCDVTKKEYKNSTNSRKAVVKELELLYKLEREGNGYYIREIYSTPKEKIDNRKGNCGTNKNSHLHSTVIYPELEFLMMDYITKHSKKGHYNVYCSNNILSSCTVTNKKYYYYCKEQDIYNTEFKKKGKISSKTVIKDMFQDVNTSANGIINTCLRNMGKKYGLEYEYTHLLSIVQDEGKSEVREAEDNEIKVIEQCTEEYIAKFNKKFDKKIGSLNDVNYLSKENKDLFYGELFVDVFEAIYKIDGQEIDKCFKGYVIKCMDFTKQMEGCDVKEIKDKFDEKFCVNILRNLDRKIDRIKIKIDEYVEEKFKGLIDGSVIGKDWMDEIISSKFGKRGLMMMGSYRKEYGKMIEEMWNDDEWNEINI